MLRALLPDGGTDVGPRVGCGNLWRVLLVGARIDDHWVLAFGSVIPTICAGYFVLLYLFLERHFSPRSRLPADLAKTRGVLE